MFGCLEKAWGGDGKKFTTVIRDPKGLIRKLTLKRNADRHSCLKDSPQRLGNNLKKSPLPSQGRGQTTFDFKRLDQFEIKALIWNLH